MDKNIFAIYKPKGPTSHDIIDEIRKITGIKKVGHAGTLDPLACGVLVVGVGREATKKLNEIVAKEKEYIAVIKLGEESSTDDEEGEKVSLSAVGETSPAGGQVKKFISFPEVEEAVNEFKGNVLQIPPAYSAVKIKGRKAYELIRKGIDPELKPRKVEIKEIEVLEYKWPLLKIRVVTGQGVYIRALARDIGKKLGVGGYLFDLERTRVGEYIAGEAIKLADLNRKL